MLGGTTDPSVIESEAANFQKLASILNTRLGETPFIVGDHPTIADVAIAAQMHLHEWQKLPLDDYPNIVNWMTERIETAPWWKSTHVGEGFTLPDAA